MNSSLGSATCIPQKKSHSVSNRIRTSRREVIMQKTSILGPIDKPIFSKASTNDGGVIVSVILKITSQTVGYYWVFTLQLDSLFWGLGLPIHHQEYRPVKRVANLLESRQVNLGSVEMRDPSYIEAILSLRDTPGHSYVNPWRDLSECGDNMGENIFFLTVIIKNLKNTMDPTWAIQFIY